MALTVSLVINVVLSIKILVILVLLLCDLTLAASICLLHLFLLFHLLFIDIVVSKHRNDPDYEKLKRLPSQTFSSCLESENLLANFPQLQNLHIVLTTDLQVVHFHGING